MRVPSTIEDGRRAESGGARARGRSEAPVNVVVKAGDSIVGVVGVENWSGGGE